MPCYNVAFPLNYTRRESIALAERTHRRSKTRPLKSMSVSTPGAKPLLVATLLRQLQSLGLKGKKFSQISREPFEPLCRRSARISHPVFQGLKLQVDALLALCFIRPVWLRGSSATNKYFKLETECLQGPRSTCSLVPTPTHKSVQFERGRCLLLQVK